MAIFWTSAGHAQAYAETVHCLSIHWNWVFSIHYNEILKLPHRVDTYRQSNDDEWRNSFMLVLKSCGQFFWILTKRKWNHFLITHFGKERWPGTKVATPGLMGLFGGSRVKANMAEFSVECSGDSKVWTEQNSSKILLNSSMAPRLKEIKQEINDSSLILDVISFLLFPQASEQVRILIYQKWSI